MLVISIPRNLLPDTIVFFPQTHPVPKGLPVAGQEAGKGMGLIIMDAGFFLLFTLAQIGLDDQRILGDGLGLSFRNLFPEVDDQDTI